MVSGAHRLLLGWLLSACCSVAYAGAAAGSDEFTIGPWRLGMSLAEVTSFEEFGPYEPVAVTGGLETINAMIDGKKESVSFVFGSAGLSFIQLWKYEGSNFDEAKAAALDVFDQFVGRFGGATLPKHPVNGRAAVSREEFAALLFALVGRAPDLFDKWRDEKHIAATLRLDLVPIRQPAQSLLQAQVLYSGRFHRFYVFLFQDAVSTPRPLAESDIHTEKL
jgi:hypothetical protein